MPLVLHTNQQIYVVQDGGLQKTIEHYTFADLLDTATITVDADKADCA